MTRDQDGTSGNSILSPLSPDDKKGTLPQISSNHLAVVRELLLAAFTARDLRNLFLYSNLTDLQPLIHRIDISQGLASMVDDVIVYCHKRDLVPALLAEVRRVNPGQYARFASRLPVPTLDPGGDDLPSTPQRQVHDPQMDTRGNRIGRDQITIGNTEGSTMAVGSRAKVVQQDTDEEKE